MKKKAWIFAGATFLGFLLIAILLDWLLPLAGRDRVLLWSGFLLLGAVAAFLAWRHFAPRAAAKKGKSDVDLLLDAAGKRLAASRAAGGKLRNLPVVLLLGPDGAAKTTSVLESSLEADLLAGETARGEMVAPTAALNVWFAKDRLLVEAGGSLPDDAQRWQRLLHRLRPGRIAAAFGRGRQAPRVAVVCFSCEELVAAGSSINVPLAAKKLRESVAEVSQRLGVRLPVYVLFTKADRIPHFEEFVRGLNPVEAQEILGATLPIAEVAAGGYADFQAGRLRDAFDGIFRSLARWRLELLPREGAEASRTRAYEFPREIRKISDLASTFLLELCRPSQLGINPFLRGFYFTGVRPIVVSDTAPAPAAAPQPPRISMGATGVFGLAELGTAPQPAAPRSGSRRVPDWVFLRRILPEIVLSDVRAQEMTAGGARVDLLRRTMIGVAAALLLVLATGFTVSYANNRALLTDGRAALASISTLRPAVGEPPAAASLVQLDGLRAVVDSLSEHERSGRPLRLRWGLYSGDAARLPLREVYFDRFAGMIWNDTRQDLVTRLQNLPAEPQQTADYASAYSALKAYLVTTSHPEESDPAFLTPALLESWRYTPGLDEDRQALVSRQFDFFGRELPLGNPFPAEPNEAVVIGARTFLQKFTGVEPFYRALLAEGARAGEGVQFSRTFPAAAPVLRNDFVVPAEFTQPGWERVQAILGDLDALLSREDWVLGERASIAPGERAQLAETLRTRYVQEYIAAWRDYLAAGSLAAFSGPDDAARKLDRLAGNESPLLQMLSLASLHTAVDTTVMRQAFQPVYAVVPAGPVEQFVTDENSAYITALGGLGSAMTQVMQAAGPARAEALAQAGANVEQVSIEARTLARAFSVEGQARPIGTQVQRLLEAPVTASRGLVRGLPTAEINGAGARFCTPFRALDAKFPFNARATQEASMDEVTAALQRGTSALWAFYDEALQGLLLPQGNRYAASVSADPRPTAAFVAFFNRAATISNGLFPEGAQNPMVRLSLAIQTSDALPEVEVTVDGQTHTFTRTMPAAWTFTWDGSRAGSARISGTVNGEERTLLQRDGSPWSLVRLLRDAEWESNGPGRYTLRWRLAEAPGTLTGTIIFAGGTPIFAPDALRLGCVSQVVQ